MAALIDHGRAIALPAGRATPTAAQARALAGLNLGTAGVFMDDGGNCWTTWLGTALSELCDSDAIFAATDGRCAVVHFDVGDSLLLR